MNPKMKPKKVIEKWVEAFNKGDINKITKLYHDYAINHQVANEPIIGKTAIQEMFEKEFS